MHRYSDRLSWTDPANPFTTLLEKTRAAGQPLLDLTISNPTQALTNYPHAEIAEAYGAITNFSYEPDPLGSITAREHIAACYASKIHPSQIALTASTSEAYSLLFKLLANPGGEVLIPTPSYPLFDYLAKLEGVILRPYRLLYDGSWHIDLESIETSLSSRTRALIVVNPNNPTGSFLKRAEWQRLEKLAIDKNLPLIADEVFMDYPFAPSHDRISTFAGHNNTLSFSLNGLSKSAGMPQMKLGWIIVNGPAAERAQALHRLELLLDTYLSVATPVQNALSRLLQIGSSIKQQIVDRLQVNRETIAGLHPLHCEGGWSATLRMPAILSEETWITELLINHSVIVQPGYFFDMPFDACLIVSLLTEPATFAQGIARISAIQY